MVLSPTKEIVSIKFSLVQPASKKFFRTLASVLPRFSVMFFASFANANLGKVKTPNFVITKEGKLLKQGLYGRQMIICHKTITKKRIEHQR